MSGQIFEMFGVKFKTWLCKFSEMVGQMQEIVELNERNGWVKLNKMLGWNERNGSALVRINFFPCLIF